MKHFLLGVGATLATLALALVVLLLTLGSGDGETIAAPSPTASGPGTGTEPQPPADLTTDETWLGTVDLRGSDVVSADATLTDVVATGSGVRFSESGLRAERLDLDATLPFATVATQIGDGARLYDAGGGLAGIERAVTILGRDLTVRAEGTVVADGGQLLIEPRTVDLGGPDFLDSALSSLARSLVTIRQPVPGVPDGLGLTDVAVTPAGFDASLSGTDVTIRHRCPCPCPASIAWPHDVSTSTTRPDEILWRVWGVRLGAVLVALVTVFRWIRAAVLGLGEGVPLRYVFIYLCALEILPVVLACQLALRYLPDPSHPL